MGPFVLYPMLCSVPDAQRNLAWESLDALFAALRPLFERELGFVAAADLECTLCHAECPSWADYQPAEERDRRFFTIGRRPFLGIVYGLCSRCCRRLVASPELRRRLREALAGQLRERLHPGSERPLYLIELAGGYFQPFSHPHSH